MKIEKSLLKRKAQSCMMFASGLAIPCENGGRIVKVKKNAKQCMLLGMAVVLLFTASASTEGLFPSINTMFGTAMPSIGVALERMTDETYEDASGQREVYSDFSYDDYTAFGVYLAGAGAVLKDSSASGSAITADISARNATMRFIYDWQTRTATAVYPSGTRPETERETIDAVASILPPVDGIMPSAQFAVNRKPSSEISDDVGITQTWSGFTDKDYNALSTYLAQSGATLQGSSSDAGILTAKIGLNTFSFTVNYNWHTNNLSVFYPAGTSPEREKRNVLIGKGSVLPKIETVGKELPSISQAISRVPDIAETMPDGSRREVYTEFDESDYSLFSQYLLASGCAVEGYFVEDDSVMVIELSNITGSFTFSYDALRHTGTVVYPNGSRIEAAWAPRAATPMVTATPEPIQNYFSQSQCWSAALTYFKNLGWENPSSLTIHSHSYSYDGSAHTYTFYIHYSTQNDLGECNRKTGIVVVGEITCIVTSAFVD